MSEPPGRNHYVKMLQCHEEELVSTLGQADLLELSKELSKSQVLSMEVVDNFASLDHKNLDPGLKSRYLIQQLCKAIAAEDGVWDRITGVFHSLGEDMKQVCQLFTGDKVIAMPQTLSCPEKLVEEDVSVLMSILADVAQKWKEIGTALKLPTTILEEYENCGLSFTEILHKVLLEWITRQHETALPASLQNLKIALEGKQDGLSEMAEKLEENLELADQSQGKGELEISHQSSDTKISEGKSALLEVQTSTGGSLLSFQWHRKGQPLADGQNYSDVTGPVLFIRASERVEGDYSCHVSRGGEKICSNTITLMVNSSPRDKHLVSLYSRLHKANSWPLIGNCTFNNLALAKNTVGTASLAKQTEYKEAFEYIEDGTLVIVSGCSGVGKTTLAYKLTSDWSNGIVLRQAKIVLLLTIGMFDSLKKAKHLTDILKLFYPDETKQNVLLGEIERTFGKGVCFIVDGLDSYQPQEGSKTVIYDLLQKSYLPEAAVIVTSHTVNATAFAKQGKHVMKMELSKFTDEQIFQYVNNFPFQKPSVTCSDVDPFKLKDYVRAHSTVLDLCSQPVHITMACFIHQQKEEYNLTSLTNLYKNFTQILSHDSSGGNHFRDLCKIAFEITIQQRRVISQSESEPLTQFSYNVGNLINLLSSDLMSQLLGLENMCTFLHETLQEFLAALHVAELQPKDQEDMIRQHVSKSHMQNVWKFFCGLSRLGGISATYIGMLLPGTGLFEIHCAFESQSPAICDVVVQAGEAGLVDLSNHTLTIYDLNALCYVIATASKKVTSICMNNCDLGDRLAREMMPQLQNDTLISLEKLSLASNNIGSLGATALAQRLKHTHRLENVIGYESAAASSNSINRLNLQELNLSDNNLSSDGAITLIYELKKDLLNLKVLNLSQNNIGSGGAGAIIKDLLELKSLEDLNLSHNNIDSTSALAIVRGLTRARHNLHFLHLEGNLISGDNQDMEDVLSECRSNLEVHLSSSIILHSAFHSRQTCCNIS